MTESTPPTEPTADQCTEHATITVSGFPGFACWYPQMGGYHAKAIVVPCPDDQDPTGIGCFEAYVWHDGRFPFTNPDAFWEPRQPVKLHHCDAEQFIQFGQTVLTVGQQIVRKAPS